MKVNDEIRIKPVDNERPVGFADRLGAYYTATVSQTFKKDNGQFFTPQEIAQFMGSLASTDKKEINILDPGCGTAILTCALVENIVNRNPTIETVHLTAYETDCHLISLSEKALSYLKEWLSHKGVTLQYVVCVHDFILENYDCLNSSGLNFSDRKQTFDFIISNPPYFKLSKDDSRVKAAKMIINGQPNIYALFLAIATRMLKNDAEMIFIVPRSFTSGRYFNRFRDYFFRYAQLNFIHLFDSRKDTFSRDNVLQETLILKAKKKTNPEDESEITVSTCIGLHDIAKSKRKSYFQKDLIDLKSKEKMIHLPINTNEESVIDLFKSWNGSLNRYGIQISTGPVVAFRAKDYIREIENGAVFLAPLYWLHNVTKMEVHYPLHKPDKGQYIQICDHTKSCLIPNRNYIFLRRFSSKDDKSRLIAAPYFSSPDSPYCIGVENKLNYIYRPKGHLERAEVMGIAALLNSNIFDTYFRTFNGNVNVSATELRAMPMPPLETIKEIGKALILRNNFSLANVREVTDSFFELNEITI
ncbi:MAG: Eco57I restriction-modification methylase domain-containing protein [Prevotellaceae bacterium]|jgi:adenine-specific DNA-methyltransferase|nr:Eco57I restriction-modification methylase domain-containing protein [Prevotellaceae bacterium]